MYANAANRTLPGAELFTRWLSHLCRALVGVSHGTSLALSADRRVSKGVALDCCMLAVNSGLKLALG
jgi:hypothetical protein